MPGQKVRTEDQMTKQTSNGRETILTREVNIVPGSEVIDKNPLILEEATRDVPADKVTEKEGVIEERTTDATRRRLDQEQITKEKLRELDSELP
ncbi:hypothetical protein MFLAVUS_011400 [Mucor flavus]|uniref:DUF2382 domain-containing protein n=1 Tax=Mucor flavus TaxID=439312 RepID=A0ABP9ZFE2_9FUNG